MSVETSAPRRRRVGGWIAIAAGLIIVATIAVWITEAGRQRMLGTLDPESANPFGAQALARILTDQGIDVLIVREIESARTALAEDSATLAVPAAPMLSDDTLRELFDAARDVVLLDPDSRSLDILFPGAEPAGYDGIAAREPECELADALRAGPVVPGAMYLAGSGEQVGCYGNGESYGLLVSTDGGRRVAAVDAASVFTNEYLAADGNAALALNLLGRHDTVVWYLPTMADSDLERTEPTLGELTPPWVTPVIVLMLLAGIAAAVWRGRRFGPLVTERLPVTVRAGETTEGRARLYARSHDAGHALAQLRIGSRQRLSKMLGLGRNATDAEVADAAAFRAGIDRGTVHGALYATAPAGDADLVELSTRLREIESAVRGASRPERNSR